MKLDGKTIIITGAASGIGRASAERAVKEGARVIGVDLNGENMPNSVEVIVGDVTSEETISKAVSLAGEVHGLATVAGVSRSGIFIDDISPEEWDDVFKVNVKACWRWLVGVLPTMREAGGGSVVMVASQLAFGGGQMNAAYIASKGAIISLVKTAGFELAADNVRVNAVAPGATETSMLRGSLSRAVDPDAAREYSRNRHAMKRFGRAEEIANGVIYLLSDEASFNTGSVVTIDGGWTAA